ncbi:hypothetical protein ACFUJR_00915 [Streptomyces sp. NPDC057271]|uniref:hypothetical protein n=1 Tax=unclassified Streptomyces TaxID=2593676 RepID=UPI00364482F5
MKTLWRRLTHRRTGTTPAASVAVIAAALDDYRLTTPDHQQTPHDAAHYTATYLATHGWTITPAA